MVQDATGMWETPPVPASKAPGSVGPGELPQARVVREEKPWEAVPPQPGLRRTEHATGHVLNSVA